MTYEDDILDKVKQIAYGSGLTEGGMLKAVADKAKELSTATKQWQQQFDLEREKYDYLKSQNEEAKNTQNLSTLFSVLAPILFGTPAQPKSLLYPEGVEGTKGFPQVAWEESQKPGMGNWFNWYRALFPQSNTGGLNKGNTGVYQGIPSTKPAGTVRGREPVITPAVNPTVKPISSTKPIESKGVGQSLSSVIVRKDFYTDAEVYDIGYNVTQMRNLGYEKVDGGWRRMEVE